MSSVPGGILANAPMPLSDPVVNLKTGRLWPSWLDWFTSLTNSVTASSQRIASVALPNQGLNIAATDITNGDIAAGLYRFSYSAAITAVLGPGTLTTTLDWTYDGVARSFTGTGINAAVPSGAESAVLLIRSDGASPIRYSTVYTGGGTYNLDVTLETVQT
jgi:hypothetical protein